MFCTAPARGVLSVISRALDVLRAPHQAFSGEVWGGPNSEVFAKIITKEKKQLPERELEENVIRGPEAAPNKGSSPTPLMKALSSQDPHQRIRFMVPVDLEVNRTDYLRESAVLRALGFSSRVVESITAELVPFWTTVGLGEFSWSPLPGSKHKSLRKLQILTPRYSVLFGGTLAAVDHEHWASGLFFKDDIHVYTLDEGSCEAAATTASYTKGQGVDGWEPILSPEYDPTTAPTFAFGPPQLTRSELAKLSPAFDVHTLFTDLTAEDTQNEFLRPPELFHFPHYRLIYKVIGPDATYIVDTVDSERFRARPLGPKSTGSIPQSRTPFLDSDESSYRSPLPRSWSWPWRGPNEPPPESIKMRSMTNELTQTFENVMLAAMARSPMTAEMWQNPSIFPINAGRPDASVVWNYMKRTARGENAGPAPAYRATLAAQRPSISEHLLKRPSRVQPKRPPSRPPQAEVDPNAAYRSRLVRSSVDGRVQRKERLISRLRDELRRQHEWRDELATPRDWTTSVGLNAEADKAEYTAAAGRTMPNDHPSHPLAHLHRVKQQIRDPKGWYARLSLKPEQTFVSYRKEDEINAQVREAYYALSRQFHPDRAATPQEEVQLTVAMAEINVAAEGLDSAEKRVCYQNGEVWKPRKK